jgi:hypothetical protein
MNIYTSQTPEAALTAGIPDNRDFSVTGSAKIHKRDRLLDANAAALSAN